MEVNGRKCALKKIASGESHNSLAGWSTHEKARCNQLLNLRYVLFT